MGNNFCVCDGDSNNEKESNIFSIIPQTKNISKEEFKTLTLENKMTQGSAYKSFMDDSSSLNNKIDDFLNELYKNKNNAEGNDEQIKSENKNSKNTFHCSGKFNIPNNNQISNVSNGKSNNDINFINENGSKEIVNGAETLKKNDLGFVSFKSLIVDNNHNIQMKTNKDNIEYKENKDNIINKGNKVNKDNNMTISQKIDKSKEFEENDDNNIQNNNNFIYSIVNKKNNNENGNSLNERNVNYGQLRYNEISKYSDVSDEDYLNNESNYTNSNKREENRNEQSLFDEEQNDIL